jgi:excisionase family DNA binding protein
VGLRTAAHAGGCGVIAMAVEDEPIRALATVTLDASTLDGLGPKTMDRLADLVAERLAERRALEDAPLLTTQEAARIARVHPQTVLQAVHNEELEVAGYIGQRPRLRRADVEAWVANGRKAPTPRLRAVPGTGPRGPSRPRRHVLGDALRAVAGDES